MTAHVIISVSGPDGVGKSTFCRALEDELRKVQCLPVVRLWLRWNPRARTKAAASGAASTVSTTHRGHPLKRLAVRVGFRSVWLCLGVRSYQRQLKSQLGAVPEPSIIIADRFTPDFIADQLAGRVLRPAHVAAILHRLPPADYVVFLDVPDQTLLERRHSTDDPELLIERAELYRSIAKAIPNALVGAPELMQVDLLGRFQVS